MDFFSLLKKEVASAKRLFDNREGSATACHDRTWYVYRLCEPPTIQVLTANLKYVNDGIALHVFQRT